jgi:hypothetical protein
MNKLLIYLCIIICLGISISTVYADTGTYTIQSQDYQITIRGDRSAVIDYSTKWTVTGGNIPWVTVGLPTSDFSVTTFGGNAQNVESHNSMGWSGVYVTLDKEYQSGESFEFNFQVVQNNFVSKYGDKASIQFTPVWWDNSEVGSMDIKVFPPEGITAVSTSSEPTSFENGSVYWAFNNIENGGRRTIGLTMPIDAFPGLNETSGTSGGLTFLGGSDAGSEGIWLMVIFIIVIFTIIVITMVVRNFSSYESPTLSLSASHPDKEVTRRVTMKCPNDGTILEKKTIKDVTIDYCPTCGGIQFDKGEVESLIKAGVNEDELYK